ncbi:uncharacterized protein H6S33_001095 [Morchella sextelata]|uniref:uncharacterized protein n=1 Tax=Morchella sextelata TaxID=1174677 RepID=UPI001D04D88B|nr:uncharacterized protein H6S33_001095 [Morchella sextelata]KAH0608867.1 hypothetical protein H6S33_001095 [Morchella sextelata]
MRSILASSRPRTPHLRPRQHCYRFFTFSATDSNIAPQARQLQWQPRAPLRKPPQSRGAKQKSKVRFDELPQGLLGTGGLPPLPESEGEKGGESYSTVIQQARNNMRRFPQCVLLTRVGGFYELYFENAEEVGPLLGLKVGKKRAGGGKVPVSMAGFPFYQLDRYLKALVQEHDRYVAISEEFENPDKGGLNWDRKVSRIITPGTLIDEKFMNPYENNFLLAVSMPPLPDLISSLDTELGLAWLDLSTGDFFTQQSTVGMLSGDIARIGPREIVVPEKDAMESGNEGQRDLLQELEREGNLITYHSEPKFPGSDAVPLNSVEDWNQMLEAPVPSDVQASMSVPEVEAGNILLGYAQARLPGMHMKLQPPIRKTIEDTMLIDSRSMKGLEIKTTLRDNLQVGSLLHTVKRTVTKSGTRLLSNWLTSPVTSVSIIDNRLNLVETFLYNFPLREKVTYLLKKSHDSQRIVQKFTLGRGDADDLIALATTIHITNDLKELLTLSMDSNTSDANRLHRASMGALLKRLDIPLTLAKKITKSIDEEGLMQQQRNEQSEAAEMIARVQEVIKDIKDEEGSGSTLEDSGSAETKEILNSAAAGLRKRRILSGKDQERQEAWIMKKSASPTLAKLHKTLEKLDKQRDEMEENLRSTLDVPSLTLRWNPGYGHICHVKGKDVDAAHEILKNAKSVSISKSTRSFHLPEWTELGRDMDILRQQIRGEEQNVFKSLRDAVIKVLLKLRRNAAVLDELDIACSFAALAQEQNLVRPILNLGVTHKIIGGRHTMVQAGLQGKGRSFTPNDCFVGDKERLWIVTGPNMAGKSTFLRQNALISILAQTGSFVPAEYAEIGIVDRIFSRVGSADNLFRDQSTFMVEMMETAQILKQATPRSFVIMDEVGRGTTPVDGLAVAYACLHHLYTINRSRALFATHFHQLAEMVRGPGFESVGCYCTDLEEAEDGSFAYIHKLRKGVNTQSHALKVALLAGIPESAIRVAEETLGRLQGEGAG